MTGHTPDIPVKATITASRTVKATITAIGAEAAQ
jgi:hypothetical protein